MDVLLHEPVQARSRLTLAAIVEATEALLRERPLAEIPIGAIVARAGCTTGSFYARFPSKDALIPYLYRKYDEDLTRRLEALLDEGDWDGWTLEEAIERLAEEMVGTYVDHLHLMREVTIFARRFPDGIDTATRGRRARLQSEIAARLAACKGRIAHPDPAKAIAFIMFAAGAVAREMILFAHAPLAQSSPLRPSDLVRQIRRLATAYLVMPAERDR